MNISALPSNPMSKNLLYMMIAAAFILALSLGVRHGFGLYLMPMSQEFGWGHGVFSLAIASQNLIWGAVQPFTGALADRFGTKIVVIVGGILYVVGLGLMAVSSTGLLLNLSAGLILGLALSATSFSILLSAVGKAVAPEKRSQAMGIASAAGSFGQFIMLPATLLLIKNFGWSSSILITAVLVAFIIPLALLIKSNPSNPSVATSTQNTLGFKDIIKIALKSPSFLWLSAGFFVCGFQVVFIGVHLPSYLIDHGFDVVTGTIFLALVGLFNIVGTYGAGWLGDRYSKTKLLMAIYGLRGVAIILFLLLPLTQISVYLFGMVMGILWLSTVPLTNGLVAKMFGVKYLSMLTGVVFFTHQVGSFLGGWLGGLNHDVVGNYNIIWVVSIILSVFGVVVHFWVKEEAIVDA